MEESISDVTGEKYRVIIKTTAEYKEQPKVITEDFKTSGFTPNIVFKSPVTKGMTYGFYDFKSQNLNDIHKPIIKCEETKYADSQVRAGLGK